MKQGDSHLQERIGVMQEGLAAFVGESVKTGAVTREQAETIVKVSLQNILSWFSDPLIDQAVKNSISKAILHKHWANITEAFWQNIEFGTGGIRGRAVLTESELYEFAEKGLASEILRGTNTINEVILMTYTAAVADWIGSKDNPRAVVGYDSRLHGREYAELVAKVFLGRGFTVYLFDDPCPFPELSFAVTRLGTDIGIEISASHNDKRYNGYKITNRMGASLSVPEREQLLDYIIGNSNKGIPPTSMRGVRLVKLEDAPNGKLVYLGGEVPKTNVKNGSFIDMHAQHRDHVKTMILDRDLVNEFGPLLRIGYCAFYGAGFQAVPRLFKDLGFINLYGVKEMNRLDGLFPAFKLGEVVDPGDPKSANLAVDKFIQEHGNEVFVELDMMVGTDPDSDRMGLVVNIPKDQQSKLGKWKLLSANDVWTLLLWYRLKAIAETNGGKIPTAEMSFIIKNHVTTDALALLARKYGVVCAETWVGFGGLADAVIQAWQLGKVNLGIFEESNGFSIGGAKPMPGQHLGVGGHTLEKDGTLAAVLVAEVAAFARSKGLSLVELLDRIYLDPSVGYFATTKLQLPEEGVFEGFDGEFLKRKIIGNVARLMDDANARAETADPFRIAGISVVRSEKYATGKYDRRYWSGFPDEGIRFYFDKRGYNHVTVRPSGTEAKLRFMVQHKMEGLNEDNIVDVKAEGERLVESICQDTVALVQKY